MECNLKEYLQNAYTQLWVFTSAHQTERPWRALATRHLDNWPSIVDEKICTDPVYTFELISV